MTEPKKHCDQHRWYTNSCAHCQQQWRAWKRWEQEHPTSTQQTLDRYTQRASRDLLPVVDEVYRCIVERYVDGHPLTEAEFLRRLPVYLPKKATKQVIQILLNHQKIRTQWTTKGPKRKVLVPRKLLS